MIFPEARLGFVDAEGSGAAQGGAVVFGGKPLLVKTVAGFVENAKEGLRKILLVVARGQAAVGRAVRAAKGVRGGINASGLKIKTDRGGDFLVERLLGGNRVSSVKQLRWNRSRARERRPKHRNNRRT